MSKKRPKEVSPPCAPPTPTGSKLEPAYWRGRLFKCRYTYKGRNREVRNWSVKIQHLGRRRTFSLKSSRRGDAAAEACELYRVLARQGWVKTLPLTSSRLRLGPLPGVGVGLSVVGKLGVGYWRQRLIRRDYTMRLLEAEAGRELSVRIGHGGVGHYFPLGSSEARLAAVRAQRIYQTIADQGWEAANKRYSRELTVAFRWLDVPLAWTYTTIHTQPRAAGNRPVKTGGRAAARFEVAIVESETGVRHALEWCLNQMIGFRCVATYGSAAEALRGSTRRPNLLLLVNTNLADKPGSACLAELKVAVPETCGLLYTVYEDSEELFRATPGGAGTYLLRRTAPTQFLEPIEAQLKTGQLLAVEMAAVAWHYFKDTLVSMPVGQSGRQLAHLTQREHEVLGLLSKGHPDKDIADRLGISIYTVHEHVRKILDKLGAHNRTEAAVKFLQK